MGRCSAKGGQKLRRLNRSHFYPLRITWYHVFLRQLYKFKHCLITNDVNPGTLTCDNGDIVHGDYWLLDLTKPPFNFQGVKVLTYQCRGGMKQVLYIQH